MKRAFTLIQVFLIAIVCSAQLSNPRQYMSMNTQSYKQWKYKRWELVGGVGTAHLYGDIGGYSKGSNVIGLKDFSFKNLRFNVAAGMRYNFQYNLSLRLNLNVTGLHASDSKGSNETRGFESSTYMFEPDLLAEYCIIKSKYESDFLFSKKTNHMFLNLLNTLSLYGFAGIGCTSYKVNHNDVQVVGTTSNGGFAVTIPAGFSLNMLWNSRTSFGVEFAVKYALSDYIDGYTSQFSKSNDFYHTITFTYSYKLLTGKRGGPSFARAEAAGGRAR